LLSYHKQGVFWRPQNSGCSSLNIVFVCLFRRDFCLVVLMCEFGIPAELGIVEVFLSNAQQIRTPDCTSFPVQFHILPNSISHPSEFNFTSFPVQFHIPPSSLSQLYQFNFTFSTIQFHIHTNSVLHLYQFNFTSLLNQFRIPPSLFSHPYQFNFASLPVHFHILPSSFSHPYQFNLFFFSSFICSLPLIVWSNISR
jgi:hypothetical protein